MQTPATQDPLLIAEDARSYRVPWPNQVRHDAGDVVLFHAPATPYWAGNASRIRFEPSSLDRRIGEVRAWFAECGRDGFLWMVGASATPGDIAGLLLGRGAYPEPDDPILTPMVLDHEPPPAPADIALRRVETLEDYRLLWEIDLEGFATPEEDREELRAELAKDWPTFQADTRQIAYLATIDGETVAYGRLALPIVGPPFLAGGATLPAARGRGAYRALVRARWDEAVRLGTPALIVQAGRDSRPILERLGFRGGPPIHVLVDHSGIARPPGASTLLTQRIHRATDPDRTC